MYCQNWLKYELVFLCINFSYPYADVFEKEQKEKIEEAEKVKHEHW